MVEAAPATEMSVAAMEAGAREANAALSLMLPLAALELAEVEPAERQALMLRHGPRTLAVGFSVDGAFHGRFAVMMSQPEALAVVGMLLRTPVDTLNGTALAALSEVGNIAVSAFLNGAAKTLKGVWMPSIPNIIVEQAERVVRAALPGSGTLWTARLRTRTGVVELAWMARARPAAS